MPISLAPISPDDFEQWMRRSGDEYARDLVATGSSEQQAREQAERTLLDSFPDKAPRDDSPVFHLVDETGTVVGYLWIGRDRSDDPTSWWVWDIVVEAEHRGNGFGRAGMELAERHARSQGAHTLGLSVFGFNRSARRLYESLGYETTSVKMRKQL